MAKKISDFYETYLGFYPFPVIVANEGLVRNPLHLIGGEKVLGRVGYPRQTSDA